MVTNVQKEDRPEPWLKKKKPVVLSTRETRTSAKVNARNDKTEDILVSNVPCGNGRGRRKGKSKIGDNAKGIQNRQSIHPTAAALVLGHAQKTVLSVAKQCRKTEEDARACGRVTSTASNPTTRKSCPTTTAFFTASPEQDENNSQPMLIAVPSGNPNTVLTQKVRQLTPPMPMNSSIVNNAHIVNVNI